MNVIGLQNAAQIGFIGLTLAQPLEWNAPREVVHQLG